MSDRMLIHIGRGDDRQTYDFHPGKIMSVEAIAVETLTGKPWREIVTGLPSLSMISVVSVVWILRKRSEPFLQFAEVQFETGDVQYEDPDIAEAEAAAAVLGETGPKEDQSPPEQS